MSENDRDLIDQLAWWVFKCTFDHFEDFLADLRYGWGHDPELLARMEAVAIPAWNLGQYRWAQYVHEATMSDGAAGNGHLSCAALGRKCT